MKSLRFIVFASVIAASIIGCQQRIANSHESKGEVADGEVAYIEEEPVIEGRRGSRRWWRQRQLYHRTGLTPATTTTEQTFPLEGLVAAYELEELKDSANFYDAASLYQASGETLQYQNNLSPTGQNNLGAVNTPGVTSSGLPANLDGARVFVAANSEYASKTDAASLNAFDITGDLTLCVWVKLDSVGSTQRIFTKYFTIGDQRSYMLSYITGTGFRFIVSGDGTFVDGVTGELIDATTLGVASTGTWYHVVAVADFTNDKLQMYINGSLDTEETGLSISSIFNSSSNFYIGILDLSLNDPLDGQLSQALIYNRALNANEISYLYGGGDGVELPDFFPTGSLNWAGTFGLSSNDALFDNTANEKDLTQSNTPTIVTGETIGNGTYRVGDFEADNTEYYSHADDSVFDVTGSLTVACWVKLESVTGGNQDLLSKFDGITDQRSFLLTYQNSIGSIRFVVNETGLASGNEIFDATTSLNTSQWYHVAATFDPGSTTARIYINGVVDYENTSVTSASIHSGSEAFYVGAREEGVSKIEFLDGKLFQPMLFSRALRAEEIAHLYNNGTPLQFPHVFPLRGLVSYWDFDQDGDSSSTLNDAFGSNDLTGANSPTITTGFDGQGNAGDFDRPSSQYYSITDAAQTGLDIEGDMTFVAFFNPETLTNTHQLFMKNDGPSNQRSYVYQIADVGGAVYQFRTVACGDGTAGTQTILPASTFGALSTARWYNFVGMHEDGVEITAVVNLAADTTAHTTGNFDNAEPVRLSIPDPLAGADGLLDRASVHNVVLTPVELRALFGGFSPATFRK